MAGQFLKQKVSETEKISQNCTRIELILQDHFHYDLIDVFDTHYDHIYIYAYILLNIRRDLRMHKIFEFLWTGKIVETKHEQRKTELDKNKQGVQKVIERFEKSF